MHQVHNIIRTTERLLGALFNQSDRDEFREWQLAALLNFVMLGLCHKQSMMKAMLALKT